MRRFVSASEENWNLVYEQARAGCVRFRNAELPLVCTPGRGDVGFEVDGGGSARLLVQRGGRYRGTNPETRSWIESGTKEFPDFASLRNWIVQTLGTEFSEVPSNNLPPRQSFISRILGTAAHTNVLNSNARVVRSKYRVKDGSKTDYYFSFEKISERNWRVYILDQPGYGGRATDSHSTHRLSDGDRKYICWSSDIPDLESARTVAALWADATQEYIRSGKKFG